MTQPISYGYLIIQTKRVTFVSHLTVAFCVVVQSQ